MPNEDPVNHVGAILCPGTAHAMHAEVYGQSGWQAVGKGATCAA